MANLKEIRDRIKSVKNTRKITEAMRLVAAAMGSLQALVLALLNPIGWLRTR